MKEFFGAFAGLESLKLERRGYRRTEWILEPT